MVETRKISRYAGAFFTSILLLCLADAVYGDECKTACTAPCTALKCHVQSGAFGGCWFDGTECHNCKAGDKDVSICEQYGQDSCNINPCSLDGNCKWATAGLCTSSGAQLLDCMVKGCKFSYRCMADGECVHFTTPVQQYCNKAYKEHGLFYDLKDLSACQKVAGVCKEIDKKCSAIPDNKTDEKQRKNECLTLQRMCIQCQGDCELQRSISGIENIIYGIAAGLAIIMFVINGLRLATSDDAVTRNNAKQSIIYVVIGLAVIAVAVKAVEYLWISFI